MCDEKNPTPNASVDFTDEITQQVKKNVIKRRFTVNKYLEIPHFHLTDGCLAKFRITCTCSYTC